MNLSASFSRSFAFGIRSATHKILNIVWTTAMLKAVAGVSRTAGSKPYFQIENSTSINIEQITLNIRWTKAVRFAFLFAPTDEISAVTQVPMFWPIMIGIAAPSETWPVTARACKMPTEAELDWIMPVRTAPTKTPKNGFLNITNICWNSGTSERPLTEPDIASIPNIRVAKPRRTIPLSFFSLFLENI